MQASASPLTAGTTDEDTLTGDLDSTNNVLANDTGNTLTVTSFDALSTNGAIVNVNPDGTFTYDPSQTLVFQQLGNGSGAGAPASWTLSITRSPTRSARPQPRRSPSR